MTTTTQSTTFEKLFWTWKGYKIQYSVDLWVELLKDFYQEHIKLPAVFIGNSVGALISLTIAVEHPEITSGAVLINAAGGLSHRSDELNPLLGFVIGSFNK